MKRLIIVRADHVFGFWKLGCHCTSISVVGRGSSKSASWGEARYHRNLEMKEKVVAMSQKGKAGVSSSAEFDYDCLLASRVMELRENF